ncbi:MAG: DNA polymerase IV [Planctomycetota bacterium]
MTVVAGTIPAMTGDRTILHVDMDAFFASVEQLDHPPWRGKPVLVGSEERRGVVAAASYEARAFGCHSAQPMSIALRRCPQAIVARPRGARYGEMSRRMFAILHDMTPLVEGLSIDEAFLDLTGTERLMGPAVEVAARIRARIRRELGLTASVGVAPNKFLAKLASDLEKPDGLTVIHAGNLDDVILPLPVTRMWGVGPKTAERLEAAGIRTFADLRALTPEELNRRFGSAGEHFHRLCRGVDDRPVTPHGEAKSMGREQTFAEDLRDPLEVRRILLRQCDEVARRLRKHGVHAGNVTVKIRYGDFETITRSHGLAAPTDLTAEIRQAAKALFDRWSARSFRPVRLIGVTAGRLRHGGVQKDLFAEPNRERQRALDDAVDRIRDRFGKKVIGRPG